MKHLFLILLIFLFYLNNNYTYSSEKGLFKKLTVKFDGNNLNDALSEIQKETGVALSIEGKKFKRIGAIYLDVKDLSAGRILTQILRPRGLQLKLLGGSYKIVSQKDLDEFKIKRSQVFEFNVEPNVSMNGDDITISFETKDFCDVTVAVEDGSGKIICHVASGVLGINAPEPFNWNSKKQTIHWDSKNDQGKYVLNKDNLKIRVSLGLKPVFERNLLWSPYRSISEVNKPIMTACDEGVLVYEGQIYDNVRLYNHKGEYVRSVYPFPAKHLNSFKDLHWTKFPQDGKSLPAKEWFRQAGFLTSGDNSNHPFTGHGKQRMAHDGHGAGATHHAASTMGVHGKNIALSMYRMNRFTTDGAAVGSKLNGGTISFKAKKGGLSYLGANKIIDVHPSSTAFSPDGKWIYLAGYYWRANYGTGGKTNHWLHGVVKVLYEGDGRPIVFAGKMTQESKGNGQGQFHVPTSVACDSKGRVYVSDYMNDRIQVFNEAGNFLKSIAVTKPAKVIINQKNGNISVFSWIVSNLKIRGTKVNVPPRLTKLGSFDNPGKGVSYEIPVGKGKHTVSRWEVGLRYIGELDTFGDEDRIWFYGGSNIVNGFSGYKGQKGKQPYWQSSGIKVFSIKDNKLKVDVNFGAESAKTLLKSNRVMGTNRSLCVNPKDGHLFVGDGSATIGFSWSLSTEINPETGKPTLIHLPFDVEGMAFDHLGLAYLRDHGKIVRFDSKTWKEVPWDYGVQFASVGVSSTNATGPGRKRFKDVKSALVVPFWEHAPNGGFSISPKGNVVLPIKGRAISATGNVLKFSKSGGKKKESSDYVYNLHSGRSVNGLIQIYDQHGKPITKDAVPGLTYTHGVKIDKDNNIYALAQGNRVINGKPYFNAAAGTLMKFPMNKAKILAVHNKAVPVKLKDNKPKRSPDYLGGGKTGVSQGWAQGAEWFYGGVGYNGENHKNPDYGCDCCFSSWDLDLYARSFVPEVGHCSVAVLDSNGNLILRIGSYGNVDDGVPLIKHGGPPTPTKKGGDEVALFYAPHLAIHSDHRLFIADLGNERILSIKLDYHKKSYVNLKDVKK